MKDKLFKTLCILDKESSRFLNMLKNIVHPLKNETVPSVTVDGDDEEAKAIQSLFARRYEGISGTDIKIYIMDEDNNFWGMKRPPQAPLPAATFISGITFGQKPDAFPGGTIICPIFSGMRPIHKLFGKTKKIIIHAATEYGTTAVLYEGIVQFHEILNWGVSIDDIAIEVHLNFTQLSQVLDLEE